MVEGVNPVASKPRELISNNVQLYRFCWTQGSYKKESKWKYYACGIWKWKSTHNVMASFLSQNAHKGGKGNAFVAMKWGNLLDLI